jgi:hypothetical protein
MIGTYSESSTSGTLGWLISRAGMVGSLPGDRKLLMNEGWSRTALEVSDDWRVDLLPNMLGKLDRDECALRTNLDRRFGLGGGASAASECSSMMGVVDREWFIRLSILLLRLIQSTPPSSEVWCDMTGGDIWSGGRAGGTASPAGSGVDDASPAVEWAWPMV